jgi:hypothetical protein
MPRPAGSMSGQVRIFRFEEIREVHRVVEAGKVRGKMVVVHRLITGAADRPALALASPLH